MLSDCLCSTSRISSIFLDNRSCCHVPCFDHRIESDLQIPVYIGLMPVGCRYDRPSMLAKLSTILKQEAQLMLTNPRDAFSGQSRSPNIVPFHMLGIVSSCAIVTLSLRGAVFTIFDFKKCRDLEIGIRGHSKSLKVAPFKKLCVLSY